MTDGLQSPIRTIKNSKNYYKNDRMRVARSYFYENAKIKIGGMEMKKIVGVMLTVTALAFNSMSVYAAEAAGAAGSCPIHGICNNTEVCTDVTCPNVGKCDIHACPNPGECDVHTCSGSTECREHTCSGLDTCNQHACPQTGDCSYQDCPSHDSQSGYYSKQYGWGTGRHHKSGHGQRHGRGHC